MPNRTGPEVLVELIRKRVEKIRRVRIKEASKRRKHRKPSANASDLRDHQVAAAQLGGSGLSPIDEVSPADLPVYEAVQLDLVIQHETRKMIRKRMRKILPGKVFKIIVMRFGMNGHEPMTLQEIGDRLHLSRERIRQIESEAFQELRQDRALRELF